MSASGLACHSLAAIWGTLLEITTRDLVTVLHGMGFGALFMLAFSGAIAELYRGPVPGRPGQQKTLLAVYLTAWSCWRG